MAHLKFIVSLLLLKLTLIWLYKDIMTTSYSYYGFTYESSSITWSIINWIIFLFCSLNLSLLAMKEKISSYIVVILFCLSFIPCAIYFEYSGLPDIFLIYLYIYWFLLITFTNIFPSTSLKFGESNKNYKKNNYNLHLLGEALIIFFALYVCIVKYSFNGLYIQLDLSSVYELRSSANDYNFGGLSGYLISWASLSFTIRGILALARKEYFILISMMMLQIVIFSIAGHKFYLLSLPTALILTLMYRKRFLYFIPSAFVISSLAGKFIYAKFEFIFLVYLLQFRNMFIPALTTGNFLDFFSVNRPDFLTQSILGRLGFESEYALPLPYLIDNFYSDGTASANTGLLADAYSNFGFFGILLYPILFAFILRMIDSAAKKIDIKYNAGIIVFFSIAFLNTAFFTALLTGGVLFGLFFLNTQSSPKE